MKKYLNIALVYAILAMVGGVFYREFTKIMGFTGITTLSKVHGHLFALGMLMFMLVGLFAKEGNLEDIKSFKLFMLSYNIGLIVTSIMLVGRGVSQVLGLSLSRSLDLSISGIAGLGHILLGIGIICLITALKKQDVAG